MEEARGRALVREESKTMYQSLLAKVYSDPTFTAFPLSEFLSVWQRAQSRNERRIHRDITTLLVPSAEVLAITGRPELEHVAEEIDVEWTKCSTLAGPMPKPDHAVGFRSSAFSEQEMSNFKTTPRLTDRRDLLTICTSLSYFAKSSAANRASTGPIDKICIVLV